MFPVEVIDVGLELGGFDGGGNGKEELITGMGGRVTRCGNLVAVEGGFGGGGGDEVAHGELVKGREVGVNLLPAAAGKEGDPGLGGVEVMLGSVGLARK
jgi:hypothetical protein